MQSKWVEWLLNTLLPISFGFSFAILTVHRLWLSFFCPWEDAVPFFEEQHEGAYLPMPYSTLLLLFLQWRGQRMNFICFWRHCSWFYPRWHLCSFYHFSKERSARHILYIFSYFNKGEIYSFNYLFDGISADLRSNITSHIFWDIDSYLSGYLTKWKASISFIIVRNCIFTPMAISKMSEEIKGFISGAFAGVTQVFVMQPFEKIKLRQVNEHDGSFKYHGFLRSYKTIMKEEGFLSFY